MSARERGAASIVVELHDGTVTVTHGDDGTVLATYPDVPAGAWGALWDGIAAACGGARFDVEPASKAEHVRSERAHRAAARVAAANVDPGRMAAVHGDPA